MLLGTALVSIVGLRHYGGVCHRGEWVSLAREPHNQYDANAVRVDNTRGVQARRAAQTRIPVC